MDKKDIIVGLMALLPFAWLPYVNGNDTARISADNLYCGQRTFFVALCHAIQNYQPKEKNLFFSPHSIHRALLLAYFGASGKNEKSLKKVLHLDWANKKDDVSHAYDLEKLARADRLKHQTIEFNSAEKLYFSENLQLK